MGRVPQRRRHMRAGHCAHSDGSAPAVHGTQPVQFPFSQDFCDDLGTTLPYERLLNRADGEPRMNADAALREHLKELLTGSQAHLDFERAVADLPAELRGARPPGLPHSAWRLVE